MAVPGGAQPEGKKMRLTHDHHPPGSRGRRTFGVAALALLCMAASPAQDPPPCPQAHQCFALAHATLAVPDAYIRAGMPGVSSAAAPHLVDPRVVWVSFWMPDASPAARDKEGSFSMFPDAFEPREADRPPVPRDPPAENPRTRVDVRICLLKAIEEGSCVTPDQRLTNAVRRNNYPRIPDPAFPVLPVDPAEVADLMEGVTNTLVNVDHIQQFGAFYISFGRAGCDGPSCAAHFDLRVARSIPYPPYAVADGNYEIKALGFRATFLFVHLDEARDLAMGETINRLVQSWVVPQNQGNLDHAQ